MAAIIRRNLSIESIAYLWILIAAMASPVRLFAYATNDRVDDAASPSLSSSASSSGAATSAAQMRLSHLQNAEPHAANPLYLLDTAQYYQQSPVVNRLLSRYHDAKRSWQNLQSSWGKRDPGSIADYNNGMDSIGSDLTPDEYADILLLLNKPYGVDFTSASRIPTDTDNINNGNGDLINDEEFVGVGEKRAWNKMNTAWGKRLAGRNSNAGKNMHTYTYTYI